MNGDTPKTAMVLEVAGKQYVAEPGSRITVSLGEVKDGEKIIAKDLLTGNDVQLKVLKSFLGEKIRGLKFKNKIRYTRRYGHRQQLTQLEVVVDTKPEKKTEKVAKKAAAPKAKTSTKKPTSKAGKK